MTRRPRALATLGPLSAPMLAAALALAGCDAAPPLPPPGTGLPSTGVGGDTAADPGTATPASDSGSARAAGFTDEERRALLNNVIRLIETAVTSPGGANFDIAKDNLNQYFAGADPAVFAHPPAVRAYLGEQLSGTPFSADTLEGSGFETKDARHLEDCRLYHIVATRVAGQGETLARVRRVFDWVVRQVQLVPVNSLTPKGLDQVPSRPYDTLTRGAATEEAFAERSWVFMALCRQLGVDAGLVTYTPKGGGEPVRWVCAAAIDGRAYLFDARIGLEVPRADGTGVATLDEAIDEAGVLEQLNLPGQSPYYTTRADLAAGPVDLLVDSSLGYLSPKMKRLQGDLAGRNRMVLYRDPVEQAESFRAAMGDRLGQVRLWPLPLQVEFSLFNDPRFVQSAQYPIQLFDPKLPLLRARLAQLRGELDDAVQQYVSFRLSDRPILVDRQRPITAEAQRMLDLYATYFLALCHLDRGHPEQAEFLFGQSLAMAPQAARGVPPTLFGWGARYNLGRLAEAKGDRLGALDAYAEPDPTVQHHGNLLRARGLVWTDPLAPEPPPEPATEAPPVEGGPAS